MNDHYNEPNTKITTLELYEGLKAKSQNCWPSVKFDLMSINDKLSIFIQLVFIIRHLWLNLLRHL